MQTNANLLINDVPLLRGERLYIPFVGAIIEQATNEKKQILVQIREKDSDRKYSGCFEIPGGKLRAFEDLYTTLRREVKEECGLEISFISKESDRMDYQNQGDTSTLISPFCVTQMQEGPFIGIIFLCQASGEPIKCTDETREAQWIDIEDLRKIVQETPEKIYTAFLAPLIKYINLQSK